MPFINFGKKEKEVDPETVKELLIFSATRYQQDFYELLSDWNEYDIEKPHILKNCIGTVLFGPPKAEENNDLTSVEDSLFNYKSSQMRKINRLYDKIVEHGTQNTESKKILCGLVYSVIFHEKSIKHVDNLIHKEDDFNGDCLMNYVSPVPVFKVLKNKVENTDKREEKETTELKLEIYYIDDSERVYKSWTAYLTNNVLPPCVMVVPYGGEYQGDDKEQWTDEMSYVWVDVHESPACGKKVVNALDTSSTVLGVGSMAISAAAIFTPVGAAVAIAGCVGLGVSSLWTMGRSSQTLIDRAKHDQSINITNREGFTCWFGIASSALAFASTGGTMLLTRAIRNGSSISRTFQLVHDGVQITTITTTGITAGMSVYNIYDNYKENQVISKQEIFNLMASLLVLGNSVVNLKLSKTIIENHQNTIIKDFEASLRSNRHRKEFNKMVKNTKSVVENPIKVKEQIIRGINKIENKDEFFASILRNKKSMASEGIKPAFIDGKFVINGKTLMNPIEFVKISVSANTIPVKHTVVPSTSTGIPNKSIFENALGEFVVRHAKELGAFVIPTITQFAYVLTDISDVDKPDVIFSKLLTLALKISKAIIQERYPATNILVKAVDFLWDYIKACIKERLRELLGDSKEFREVLMKILIVLYSNVEQKLDEWVASFKEYLKLKVTNIEDKVKSALNSQFERINNASRSLLSNGSIS